MQFIAKKRAYLNDHLLEAGEKFEAESGFSASWAVPAKEYKPEPEESEDVKIEKAREGLQGAKKKARKKAKKKVAKKG